MNGLEIVMKKRRREHFGIMVVAWGMLCFIASLPLPGSLGDLNAAGLTTVRLSGHSEIDGDEMFLGRIAEIDGPNRQFVRALRS